MNNLDRKLAGVFKALLRSRPNDAKASKARKDFSAVRQRVIDTGLGSILDDLFDDLLRQPELRRHRDPEEALGCVVELRDRGFVEAAAVLFVGWRDVLGKLGFDRIFRVAPDSACLEAWLRAAKAPAAEIEKTLLVDVGATYLTVGADWLMGRGRPGQLLPLLELFLSRQDRPPLLPSWSEALVTALKRDKRGVLLVETLRHPWSAQDRIVALAEAVRHDRPLLRTVIALLPSILAQKDAPSAVIEFVDEIFKAVATTEGSEREFMTSALAQLGIGILLADRRGPQSEVALTMIRNTSRQLRNLSRDEALKARTWLLENLSHREESTDGKLHVTTEGARHLALAFEKAAQGFSANDILTVTARNLGLSQIGKPDEKTAYNPLRHEDVVGGLVPGDLVRIHEVGWTIGQEALIRAKVKKAQGGSYV